MRRIPTATRLGLVCWMLCPGAALAAGAAPGERCAGRDPLRQVYFGDLHVHTALSLDASTQGTRNRPRDAFRFARGEPLGLQPYDAGWAPQRSLRLARPLDFVAVTDHAEMLGEREICQTPGAEGHGSLVCGIYRSWPRLGFFLMNTKATYFEAPSRFGFCGPDGTRCLRAARGPWREIQQAAVQAYEPCSFTSFVGYEWTGTPGTDNIHRNVIFRNHVVPELPISYVEAPRPEQLWERLDAECIEAGAGCDALVIPHNSNLSGGRMFLAAGPDGEPLQEAAARTRARIERLVEVMQHKGDSECMPGLGNADELCAFEKLAESNFQGRYVGWLAEPPPPASFVRNALEAGLLEEARLGVNPFRFGLVAGTDTHLGTPGAVEEDERYPGHGGAGKPARTEVPPGLPDAVDFNPGGLTALWAEQNSREALFAAMRRREAYGTSGPRIVVRFFGGWDYPRDLCDRGDFAAVADAGGVPMGGVLRALPEASPVRHPTFAVNALRDPGVAERPGTPLQRLQVVKGWLEGGKVREAVYEVAGDPENGARVDLASCEPVGRGFDALCSVWSDPDFDASEPAFYYARVIENPTCRWSQRVCNAHGVDCANPGTIGTGLEPCCKPEHRRTIQERAWTSPIWHRPAGREVVQAVP